ncbi:MAG: peptide chain release factor N(5)-glutamine methyltransferase [Candidatus Krumholzibacteriaceae bacterium]|jgi:release factor glutamine methyltransferase
MTRTTPAKCMKVLETLRLAEGYLSRHGVESARLSAEHMLAKRLGCSRLDLYLRFDQELASDVLEPYREDLKVRATHYPLQYILGEIEFLSLPFKVREGVFIPRPETELLVEWIEELAGEASDAAFVEFGVGSGVISGSLCRRHPLWRGRAIDVSADAVVLARENFEALGVAARMELSVADGLDALDGERSFDLFVANPPYVPTAAIAGLEAEVSRFEERRALDGGAEGIDFYPVLAREAARLVRPGGLVAFEIGHAQGEAVRGICAGAGLERIGVRKDYNGLERMVTAFTPDAGGGTDG